MKYWANVWTYPEDDDFHIIDRQPFSGRDTFLHNWREVELTEEEFSAWKHCSQVAAKIQDKATRLGMEKDFKGKKPL